MCPDEACDLSLLLFCVVSIGCGANRRTVGFCSAAGAGSFARDDFVVVSIGCGANRLTFGASSFSGECLRVLDDLVVVSMGTGANRLAGADALLVSASAGIFCSGEDIARWRAVAQAFVKCYPGAHTLLMEVKGADQANSEIFKSGHERSVCLQVGQFVRSPARVVECRYRYFKEECC